jgi:hypothetical protein
MPKTSGPVLSATTEALRRWLASGVAQASSGAFYAWLDENGEPSFEYPEITGYALTHLAGVVAPTDQEIANGLRAAGWLVRRLRSGDLSARGSWDGQATYTFDLAMIATGLMSFGSRYAGEAIAASGATLAVAIRDELQSTGSLQSVPPGSGTVSSRSAWSTEGLAHLVKTVQCLLWADDLGHTGCRDAAAALVAESGQVQTEDGRFVTHPADQETMLHPHLYAVEGLWMFGTATGDTESLERARRATEWAWAHQRSTGAFPRWVSTSDGSEGPDQADLAAQALRAAVLLDVAGDRRDATAEWLTRAAVWNGDGTAAVPYQPGSGTVHRNTWTTLFAAQALHLQVAGPDQVSWRSLV